MFSLRYNGMELAIDKLNVALQIAYTLAYECDYEIDITSEETGELIFSIDKYKKMYICNSVKYVF